MQLMADGMPGHMHEFYKLVRDAPWMGGNEEYSPLNEAYTYYFNGIVPLAYGLNDARLISEVLRHMDIIIGQQHEDGWLGPETNQLRRNFWGRYPLFLGMMQLAEVAEPRLSQKIIDSMHQFVELMHKMLQNHHQGYVWRPGDLFDEQWGRSRAADMVVTLEWLYEKHPGAIGGKIHDCMIFMYEMSYDWSYWFTEGVFIKDDLDRYPEDLTNSLFPYVHGVNAGQGLKWGAVMSRLMDDNELLEATRRGVNWTFEYHGTPSGAIIGDERESGLSPVRGTELCSVVETMYSLNYLYQAMGDREFADRSEKAAFNALPVMIMPDWWAHQYIAQTNQPISHRIDSTPFWNVGNWGTTYGVDPNYPCCAMTFSTAIPKFLSSSFVRNGESGIAHVLLGPAEVHTTTGKGHKVSVTCETNYPFNNDLDYHIHTETAFEFSFRVPQWAILEKSVLHINGYDQYLSPDAFTGLHTIKLQPGKTRIRIQFGAEVRVETRANDTVSVHHGALLYALSVEGQYNSRVPGRYPGITAPAAARDWDVLPTTEWNLAIDPSTLQFSAHDNRNDELPSPIWKENAPPVSIYVQACQIDWNLTTYVNANPESNGKGNRGGYAPDPPLRADRNCTGPAFRVELRPYGSAKLHMAELPVVDLSPGSDDLWDPTKDKVDGSENENKNKSAKDKNGKKKSKNQKPLTKEFEKLRVQK